MGRHAQYTYRSEGPLVNGPTAVVDHSVAADIVAIVRPGAGGVVGLDKTHYEKVDRRHHGEDEVLGRVFTIK